MTNDSLIEKLERVETKNCMFLATEIYEIIRQHQAETLARLEAAKRQKSLLHSYSHPSIGEFNAGLDEAIAIISGGE